MGQITTFTGASGTGKDSIARALGFSYVTSTTTRGPRPSDNPGEYEYLEQEDFHYEEEAWNAFLWVTTHGGNYYGTKYEPINNALSRSENSTMILVPEVLPLLLAYVGKEKVMPFYIHSPGEAILRTRMEQRGDSNTSIDRRLKESRNWDEEAEKSGIPYTFITNNGMIEEAVEMVRKYL